MFEIKKAVRPKVQSCSRMNNTHGENRMISSIIINTCEYLFPVSMNVPVTDGLDDVPS